MNCVYVILIHFKESYLAQKLNGVYTDKLKTLINKYWFSIALIKHLIAHKAVIFYKTASQFHTNFFVLPVLKIAPHLEGKYPHKRIH